MAVTLANRQRLLRPAVIRGRFRFVGPEANNPTATRTALLTDDRDVWSDAVADHDWDGLRQATMPSCLAKPSRPPASMMRDTSPRGMVAISIPLPGSRMLFASRSISISSPVSTC